MKYGAASFPIKPVTAEIQKVSDLGFDFFELSMDPPRGHWARVRDMEKQIITALEKAASLKITLCFENMFPAYHICIAALTEAGYDDTITFEIFSADTDDLVQSRERIDFLLSR